MDRSSYTDFKYFTEACSKMESIEPPICFYVHNHYSGSDIPGFFTVPYNFKAKELSKNLDSLLPTILEER